MLKFKALLALGKYQEALAESRSLTVQGDAMAPEVLTERAQALYLTGMGCTDTTTCHSRKQTQTINLQRQELL